MTPRKSRYSLREVIVIPLVVVLLVVALLAHDWRSAVLGGIGATYLIARRWETLWMLGPVSRYRASPRSWKFGLGLLLILLLQIPILFLSDWRHVRIPAVVIGVVLALAWLAWNLLRLGAGQSPKREG